MAQVLVEERERVGLLDLHRLVGIEGADHVLELLPAPSEQFRHLWEQRFVVAVRDVDGALGLNVQPPAAQVRPEGGGLGSRCPGEHGGHHHEGPVQVASQWRVHLHRAVEAEPGPDALVRERGAGGGRPALRPAERAHALRVEGAEQPGRQLPVVDVRIAPGGELLDAVEDEAQVSGKVSGERRRLPVAQRDGDPAVGELGVRVVLVSHRHSRVPVAGELLDHDGVVALVAVRAVGENDDGQPLGRSPHRSTYVAGSERPQGGQIAEPDVGEERLECAGRHPGRHRVPLDVTGGVPDGGHQFAEVPWAREVVRTRPVDEV